MTNEPELTLPPTDHWIPGPPPEDGQKYFFNNDLDTYCYLDDYLAYSNNMTIDCHIAVDDVAKLLGGVRDE